MDGGRLSINISKYQNDMTTFQSKDDIYTLLIHLGYLGYDAEEEEIFIPNSEILEVFKDSTSTSEWVQPFEAMNKSKELLEAIWRENEERVAELLEWAHDKADNKTYNSEAALSYAVQYALYASQQYYDDFRELDTGKGYADLVYMPLPKYPDKPVLLIELKNGKSPEEALQQIEDRDYINKLDNHKGNILLIGINYDADINSKDYKKHRCVIKKV